MAELASATAEAIRRAQTRVPVSIGAAISPQVGRQTSPEDRAVLTETEVFDLLAEVPRGDGELVFGILDARVSGNLFGARDTERGQAFCTIFDWGFLSHLRVLGFVVYQCAAYLLRLSVPQLSFHDETLGCVQDYCAIKPDFQWKLRTAGLCASCGSLVDGFLPRDDFAVIVAILEESRRLAMDRPLDGVVVRPVALNDLVDDKFPFPIAQAHRALQIETRPPQRWFATVRLCDMAFRYAIAVSAAVTPPVARPADLARLMARMDRPSLGTLKEIALAWLQRLPSLAGGGALPALTQAMRAARPRDRAWRELSAGLDQLVADRNRTLGHGGDLGGDDEVTRNLEAVADLLEVLRPLANFPLVYPLRDSIRSRGGRTQFHAKVLMGSHAQFATRPFEVEGVLDTDVLLFDSEGRRVNMWPWLVWGQCSSCRHESLWIYDGQRERGLSLRECGNDHLHELPLDEVRAFLGELASGDRA